MNKDVGSVDNGKLSVFINEYGNLAICKTNVGNLKVICNHGYSRHIFWNISEFKTIIYILSSFIATNIGIELIGLAPETGH